MWLAVLRMVIFTTYTRRIFLTLRATGRKAVRLHLYSMLTGVTRSVAAPVLFWFLAAPAYWGLLWNHLHITGILVEMLAMAIGMSLGVFGCWLEVLQD
jgi:hypothetical protein